MKFEIKHRVNGSVLFDIETEVLAVTNEYRQARGLPPINATATIFPPALISSPVDSAAVAVAPDYYDQERADNREEYARLDELARSGCSNE